MTQNASSDARGLVGRIEDWAGSWVPEASPISVVPCISVSREVILAHAAPVFDPSGVFVSRVPYPLVYLDVYIGSSVQ